MRAKANSTKISGRSRAFTNACFRMRDLLAIAELGVLQIRKSEWTQAISSEPMTFTAKHVMLRYHQSDNITGVLMSVILKVSLRQILVIKLPAAQGSCKTFIGQQERLAIFPLLIH